VTPAAFAARAAFVTFALLTCAYALLAYDPFTFTQVIRFELFPGLGAFARAHGVLHVVAQAAALVSVAPALRHGPARALARAYAATAVVAAAVLVWRPLLPGLRSEPWSLWVAFLALVPVAWLAIVDLREASHAPASAAERAVTTDAGRGYARAAWSAAAIVLVAFALLAAWRGARPSAVLGYTAALHGLCAVAVGSALLLASTPRSAWAQLAGGALLLALALGAGLRRVLAAIAFSGIAALAVAAVVAATLALAVMGVAMRLPGGERLPPLARLARPLALPARWPRPLRVGAPLVACVALASAAARYDWNFLLQQTAAFAAWLLTLAALVTSPRRLTSPPGKAWRGALAAGALVLALAARGLAEASGVPEGITAALARDPSLRLLAPALAASAPAKDFFPFLARHTNLRAEFPVAPLDVQLSGSPLQATPGRKPDVFVFVVDSLRRDYLPPYAPAAAAFAPAVSGFARDAVVFERAFTRYGATGLSEPSIWVGGMMPHKQYVTPFAPMNALDKLLVTERFQEYVSVDAILEVVLPPSRERVRLDAEVAGKDYALCRTVAELRQRLEGQDRERPVFAYTQPQDQHVSRIAREGDQVPAGASFPPGFHPPVATRIQRWDACFGEFLRWLDSSGRGQDAIVVLTSDHGDSLGEEGRWGHAYTLYPEIVRVPLLVRFPEAWRKRIRCRPSELAFTADLTPTLYALFGHPVQERAPFGAPLCALDEEPPPRHRGPQLLASSYGPVYGLLDGDGARLFIADAVGYVEEAFALQRDRPERVTLRPEERVAAERAIVERIRQLEAAYGVKLD
jgi:hypothetical protein